MELLEIQPQELKFMFELKKLSTCQVQLVNTSDQHVAFKVKTTNPKRYSVRPNIGVVLPKSTCNFTVTMQAHRVDPPDMQCKDKFLIQSTIVPFGTTVENITANIFTKEKGGYIEENKLKVVLVSPSPSPVLVPINGSLKQEPPHAPSNLKDQLLSGVENLPPSHSFVTKDFEVAKDFEMAKDDEELKSKLNELGSKLNEAQRTITRLREERSSTIQEKDILQQELALLRRKSSVGRVKVGFPLLFVCFVALVSMTLGYMLRA